MDVFASSFAGLHGVAQAMLVLCLVASLGIALGHITIKGLGIGIGGVLFAGILFGHFGARIEKDVMEFCREFGLILFVYTIGIQVGPGFFAALKRSGLALNLLAATLVILGSLISVGIYYFGDIPLEVVLGLFSGAVTNTPSLAAGQQVLLEVGAGSEVAATPGLGYAVAYPFGIAGILITMALIRSILKINPDQEAKIFDQQRKEAITEIENINVEVRNDNLVGVAIKDLPGLNEMNVVASRVYRDGVVRVAHPEFELALGDILLLVGPPEFLKKMAMILGTKSEVNLREQGGKVRWERLVVTNTKVLGKDVPALDLVHAHNVVVSRLVRSGVELVPAAPLRLQFGDILAVIGEEEDIRHAAGVVGNQEKLLRQAQILPIFIGIALGVLLGSLPFHIPGMPAAVKLGLAGGPLLAAIVLARLGHLGPLVWFMPPAANHALREIGIVLFLATVGLKSGERFVDVLINGDGLMWMAYGVLITLIPLLIVGFIARLLLKMNYLTVCGLLAGSMTDPPALAFANNIAASEAPALAYATVYPLVMCLRILAPQIIVLLLWVG